VVAPGALEGPQLAPLWALLRHRGFQASVEALGGYSAREMGRRPRRLIVAGDKARAGRLGPPPMD